MEVEVKAQPEVEVLQWGRDHLIAEIGCYPVSVWREWLLQWGRDHLIAEMSPRRRGHPQV